MLSYNIKKNIIMFFVILAIAISVTTSVLDFSVVKVNAAVSPWVSTVNTTVNPSTQEIGEITDGGGTLGTIARTVDYWVGWEKLEHARQTQNAEWLDRTIGYIPGMLSMFVHYNLYMSGVELKEVILGRVATGRTSLWSFELERQNVYGYVGAVGYRGLRAVVVIFFGITLMWELTKQGVSVNAEGKAQLKEQVYNFVIALGALYLMPQIVDLMIYIRDTVLVNMSGALNAAPNYDICLNTLLLYLKKPSMINAFVYGMAVFTSVYFLAIYIGIAVATTALFAFFPVVLLIGIRDKNTLSTWFKVMVTQISVPCIDFFLMYIPIHLYASMQNNLSGEIQAITFVKNIIVILTTLMVIPMRNVIASSTGLGGGVGSELGLNAVKLVGNTARAGLRWAAAGAGLVAGMGFGLHGLDQDSKLAKDDARQERANFNREADKALADGAKPKEGLDVDIPQSQSSIGSPNEQNSPNKQGSENPNKRQDNGQTQGIGGKPNSDDKTGNTEPNMEPNMGLNMEQFGGGGNSANQGYHASGDNGSSRTYNPNKGDTGTTNMGSNGSSGSSANNVNPERMKNLQSLENASRSNSEAQKKVDKAEKRVSDAKSSVADAKTRVDMASSKVDAAKQEANNFYKSSDPRRRDAVQPIIERKLQEEAEKRGISVDEFKPSKEEMKEIKTSANKEYDKMHGDALTAVDNAKRELTKENKGLSEANIELNNANKELNTAKTEQKESQSVLNATKAKEESFAEMEKAQGGSGQRYSSQEAYKTAANRQSVESERQQRHAGIEERRATMQNFQEPARLRDMDPQTRYNNAMAGAAFVGSSGIKMTDAYTGKTNTYRSRYAYQQRQASAKFVQTMASQLANFRDASAELTASFGGMYSGDPNYQRQLQQDVHRTSQALTNQYGSITNIAERAVDTNAEMVRRGGDYMPDEVFIPNQKNGNVERKRTYEGVIEGINKVNAKNRKNGSSNTDAYNNLRNDASRGNNVPPQSEVQKKMNNT